ncbi:MAG: methyltransferase domain-containing protein [Gammaproteobacteria bacterium]|nr:methyltransferase domain-containing protein [Gammaproteobacteria bacterium]
MSEDIGQKWDEKYLSRKDLSGKPADVLTSNLHLLPKQGIALDLACGPGGNAIFLAEHGLDTYAWDISKVALSHLNHTAVNKGLGIKAEYRDVIKNPPETASFDVIVVSNFLDRSIIPDIIAALNPDGLMYYQTFTIERTKKPAPDNPAYKLNPNELLGLLSGLTIRYYREDGDTGTDEEYQGLAMVVAQKCN